MSYFYPVYFQTLRVCVLDDGPEEIAQQLHHYQHQQPAPTISDDLNIHVEKEVVTGGGVCAKIVFFLLLTALAVLIGLIITEHRELTDCKFPTNETLYFFTIRSLVDTVDTESRFSKIFAGWTDNSPQDDKDDHLEEAALEHDDDDSGEEADEHDENEEEEASDEDEEQAEDEEVDETESAQDDDDESENVSQREEGEEEDEEDEEQEQSEETYEEDREESEEQQEEPQSQEADDDDVDDDDAKDENSAESDNGDGENDEEAADGSEEVTREV